MPDVRNRARNRAPNDAPHDAPHDARPFVPAAGHSPGRRQLGRAALRAAAVLAVSPWSTLGVSEAQAQSPAAAGDAAAIAAFPDKPVKIIVPFAPGGMGDTLGRLMAAKLADTWKQPVVVENKPGASGIIGNEAVMHAAPDGYSILLAITQVVQAPSLYTKLPYDITRDFTPLSRLCNALAVFATASTSDVKSIKGYIEQASANPTRYNYGTYGAGTTSHIYAELFNRRNRIDIAHVPFKGAAPLITDMLGGHVSVSFVDLSTALPYIKGGKLNAYAVSGVKRSASLPDVPTFAELGYSGLEVIGWYAFFGPPGMPKALSRKLSEALVKAERSPEIVEKIASLGLEPVGSDADELARTVQADLVTWRNIIKEGNVKID